MLFVCPKCGNPIDIRPNENLTAITCSKCQSTFPLAPTTPEPPAETPEPQPAAMPPVKQPAAEQPAVEQPATEQSAADIPPVVIPPVVPPMPEQPVVPPVPEQPVAPPVPEQSYSQPANPAYGPQAYPPYGQQTYGQPYPPAGPVMGPEQAGGTPPTEKKKSGAGWLWALLTFLITLIIFLFIMSKTDTGIGHSIRKMFGMKEPYSQYDDTPSPSDDATSPYDDSDAGKAVDEVDDDEIDDLIDEIFDDEDLIADEDCEFIDYNGHSAVDLGLSVDWAETNIGASCEWEYGNLYQWSPTLAQDLWGGDWRTPTEAEFEELIRKCNTQTETRYGNVGMRFTGPSGCSIFLPYSGFYKANSSERLNLDKTGHYWANQLYSSDEARNMSIGSATGAYTGHHDRYSQQCVRAVIRKE